MNSYDNHQVECDLCDDEFDCRIDGTTTECGTVVCGPCCDDGAVRFHHVGDEVFAYLEWD